MHDTERRVVLGLYRTSLTRDLVESALDIGVTALDTAYNYAHFASHSTLGRITGDLLAHFEISTKVGFFPEGHDTAPARLREAVERSAHELGRTPDTVLLHNPENSPDTMTDACQTLAGMRDGGLCKAWGISSWDPRPLVPISYQGPRPDVLMVRAGLTVSAAVLQATEHLTERLGPTERWGMAPFNHSTSDRIWSTVDTRMFLVPGQQATALGAGFAAAFCLPYVVRIAVGASRVGHLAELNAARLLEPNYVALGRYRDLLNQRASVDPSATE